MPRDTTSSRAFSSTNTSAGNAYSQLMYRLTRLPVTVEELGIGIELELYGDSVDRGRPDRFLQDVLESVITQAESGLLTKPFIEPHPRAGLDQGDHHVLDTSNGLSARVGFREGATNKITHLSLYGKSDMGKSCLHARIASEAALHCRTFLIDINKGFRRMPAMRRTHSFIRWEPDLRLGLFDRPDGVPLAQYDQAIVAELCRNYSLQFAEYEILAAVRTLREQDNVNLPLVLRTLQNTKVAGWSNRRRYLDSAMLIISNLIHATGELFCCKTGMDLNKFFAGNVVLELDGLLVKHQAFLTRFFFEYLHLSSLSRPAENRPLLLLVDEAQELFQQEGVGAKILALRHYGVHLIANTQNPSRSPVEIRGNSTLVSFRLTDRVDQEVFGKAAGFTSREQFNMLGRLEVGQCICHLPQSEWKSPFLATVPRIEFSDPEFDIQAESKRFLSQFDWTPLEEDVPLAAGVAKDMDEPTERFLRDVLNQAHEASPLTQRFERAGVRSASKQGQIIKQLVADGYITVHALAVGRGRPLKLVEPTAKAFNEFDVQWKKSRGSLPTRVATTLLAKKFSKLNGWSCVREGMLRFDEAEKAVDLLLRDSENRIVAVEVAGNPKHEVHNCLACLGSNELRRHVVVCVNKSVLEAVKVKFSGFDELSNSERVWVLTLSQALREDWMP